MLSGFSVEFSEFCEVFCVVAAFVFRCFDDHGFVPDGWVVYEGFEAVFPYVAHSDVFVAVEAASQTAL